MRSKLVVCALTAVAAMCATASRADAFCGFYIDGAGKDMFNDATQVVLMRDGTRTVLSMRNTYRGPVEDFAMVVPVPVVLKEGDVKTLPDDVFDRVDVMGSPRLVEYWEQDPCGQRYYEGRGGMKKSRAAPMAAESASARDDDLGVTVEAQFDVAEYKVVILSAKESTGLETWLHQEGYQIPDGAEPSLRPYVEGGSKFFVAKVDPDKVTFKNGRAQLSPLRFHYDTESFELPIRLGLVNSSGKQDLIVNILARNQRYEVANYKNVTIPTNLEVKDEVRKKFGEFYAALFDRTIERNPGAVVTEYSWQATTCDPCPGPTLQPGDFMTLGADVLSGGDSDDGDARGRGRRGGGFGYDFVLTRLHARYGKKDVPDDLVFKAADPIVGGREHVVGKNNKLEEGAQKSSMNNFQARYIIRHYWTGKIACKNPVRGIWGGPTGRQQQIAGGGGTQAARDLAFVKRGKVSLKKVLKQSVPEIGIKIAKKPKKKKVVPPPAPDPLKPDPSKVSPTPVEAPDPKAGKKSGSLFTPIGGVGLGLVGLLAMTVGWSRRSSRRCS
jgi:hypothetical protein